MEFNAVPGGFPGTLSAPLAQVCFLEWNCVGFQEVPRFHGCTKTSGFFFGMELCGVRGWLFWCQCASRFGGRELVAPCSLVHKSSLEEAVLTIFSIFVRTASSRADYKTSGKLVVSYW